MPKPKPRVTPAAIAKLVGRVMPTVKTQQLAHDWVWLLEQDEPFAEITIDDDALILRVSCHCAPQWAAVVAATLARLSDNVMVDTELFIQDSRGQVLRGTNAVAYWCAMIPRQKLLTQRFRENPH